MRSLSMSPNYLMNEVMPRKALYPDFQEQVYSSKLLPLVIFNV